LSESLLSATGLGISFGGVQALTGIDFRLAEGELRCLIGPNGAGKSTFFKLLTGQYRPTAGCVTIRGTVTAGLEPYQIARLGVGIKTQVPSVFDGLSVDENIWLAVRRITGAPAARNAVFDVLEETGLEHLSARQVGTLSHGQRQWVELALVVASRPSLVLLDEPAAGMSDDEVKRTAQLITAINRHCALIVVEHDMEFVQMIAQKVTVFNRGSILVEGTVDEVLADPRVRDVYLGRDLEMRV